MRSDPPYVITGVTNSSNGSDNAVQIFRFDWYSATVRRSSYAGFSGLRVADDLADFLGAVVENDRPLHGYGDAVRLTSPEGETLARVMFGGCQTWPLVLGSGSGTGAAVRGLRELFPDDHWVTRADSALDLDRPGIWDELSAAALRFADDRGLKVSMGGDWHRGEGGRTLYIGSRSSTCFVRVYEKGKQMQSLGDPSASVDWVRVELSMKPLRDHRRAAATISASDLWGMAKWPRAFRRDVLDGFEVDAAYMREHRDTDHRRAMESLLRQYGPTLLREMERVGGWMELGFSLAQRLDALPDEAA